jgi:hypothetical protein
VKLSPVIPIDYKEFNAGLIFNYNRNCNKEDCLDKNSVKRLLCDSLRTIYQGSSDDNERLFILDICLAGLVVQFQAEYGNQEIRSENHFKLSLINKMLIHSLQFIRNGIGTNLEAQSYVMMRSFMEQSRLFILCLLDNEFSEQYFKGYSSSEDKTKRYYKLTREQKISKRIQDNFEAALDELRRKLEAGEYQVRKDEAIEEFWLNPKSRIYTILREHIFNKLHHDFSELSHLTELGVLEKGYTFNSSTILSLTSMPEERFLKYYDYFIEYLCATLLIIHVQKLNDGIELAAQEYLLFQLIETAHQSLEKLSTIDLILVGLKEKLRDMYNEIYENE